jgi:hypothetical protein
MQVMVYARSKIASGSNFRAYFATNLDGARNIWLAKNKTAGV